jgi:hypothetical protein
MPLGVPLSKAHRQKISETHYLHVGNQFSRTKKIAPPGMSRHPLYQIYYQMIRHCYNPADKKYKYFGAKGIIVCDRWQEKDGQGFSNFVLDVGERPIDNNLEIKYNFERIDNTKNFEPSNCHWKQNLQYL